MQCFCFKLPLHKQVKFQVLVLVFKVISMPWLLLSTPLLATCGHGQHRGESLAQGERCPSSHQEQLHSFQEKPHKNTSFLLLSEQSTERKITLRTLVFGIRTASVGLKPASLESGKQPDPCIFWTLPKFINPVCKTWLFLIPRPAGWIPEGKIGENSTA